MSHLPRLQKKYPFNVKIEPASNNDASIATFGYANYMWAKSVCENKEITDNRKAFKI